MHAICVPETDVHPREDVVVIAHLPILAGSGEAQKDATEIEIAV